MGWEKKRGAWRLGAAALNTAVLVVACGQNAERFGSTGQAIENGQVVSSPATTGFAMVTRSDGTFKGSGSLLESGEFLLTAGHVPDDRYCRPPEHVEAAGCVFDTTKEVIRTGSSSNVVERRDVERVSVHPLYTPTRDRGPATNIDVAIIQIASPFTNAPTFQISPRFPEDVDPVDLDCFGFGNGSLPGGDAGILRTHTYSGANTTVVDNGTRLEVANTPFFFLGGDSGGGCVEANTRAEIEGVISNDTDIILADTFFFWAYNVMSSAGDYVMDVDGGGPDAVFAMFDGGGDLQIQFQPDGTASELEDMDFEPFSFNGTKNFRLALGDFNADGALDYIAVSETDTRVVLGPDTVITSRLPAAKYGYVRVLDANGDGFDDVEVSLDTPNANEPDGRRMTMLGFADGLRRPALAFADAEFDGVDGSDLATITLVDEMNEEFFHINYVRGTGEGIGPTTGTFEKHFRPTKLLRGSFNGDGLDDLVLMADGHLFNYSGQQGQFPRYAGSPRYSWLGLPNEEPYVNDIHVIPGGDGEGHDLVEASMSDGTVKLYEGRAGTFQLFLIDDLSGFPSSFGEDGKMLVVSGEGFQTVAATETRLKIVHEGDSSDLLLAQIYDGEIGGMHDQGGGGVRTCVHLVTDPCGDLQVGDCDLTAEERRGTILHRWDSTDFDFADDSWTSLVDPSTGDALTNDCLASAKTGCAGPFVYELRVFLSEASCQEPPAPGATVPIPTINAFKARSNGVMSHPVGALSVRGTDTSGDFSIDPVAYMRDTSYDGSLSFPFAGALAANGITLTESDADETADQTHPGSAVGANSAIEYRLLDPTGSSIELTAVAPAEQDSLFVVRNPSGNCDSAGGPGACDVEVRQGAAFSTQEALTWRWTGVSAHNLIQVFSPFGSPPTYEMMGSTRRRAVISPVLAPSAWAAPGATFGSLPLVLGSTTPDGAPEGTSVVVSDETTARALLETTSADPWALLLREALAAKLNVARAAAFGERLAASNIYATTASLRETLQAAESAIRGPRSLANLDQVRRVTTLLFAANLGDVTYIQPGVPIPTDLAGDDDGDSVINAKDNCPSLANPEQADADGDGVGDACRVNPVVHCVLATAPGKYRALLGYDSPLVFRAIPVGRRNRFSGPSEDRGQPSIFTEGIHDNVFSVDFESPIDWRLEDTVLTLSHDLPGCEGTHITNVPFAADVALFGSEGVTLHQGAQVKRAGGYANVVSGGRVDVGTKATLGAVWARGDVDVNNKAQLAGSLVSGGVISAHGGASITGPIEQHTFVPEHELGWVVDFAGGEDITLRHSSAQRPPGNYGVVRLETGGSLRLSAGVYYFDSLTMSGGSELVLDGATFIYVSGGLDLQGQINDASGSSPQLFLGYFGSDAVALKSRFVGTLVAPYAELQLWSVSGGHSGTFFGRRVVAHANAVIEFVPPLAP